jgi:outer membrane receptor protein involved in Fe transport
MFKSVRSAVLHLAIALLALIAGGRAASAQTYTEGSIAGTVFDASDAVVANADITIHNLGTDAEVHLTSDASGFFKAPELAAAVYTVTINAAGFAPFHELNVIVQVGQTTEINPHLQAAGSTTSVEVTAEAPILNFESPDISSELTEHNIENIPLNGGRWSDMTLLTPAAVGDSNGFGLIAFRGISPILNNVEIDGADDNQAYYSEERGRTREGYSTSKYLIEEFQVNTGVYSAEFGRAAGGVINAISKSGSNSIHGIAYFSDRDNDWGAFNPYTTNTTNTGTVASPDFVTAPYKPIDWRKEWGFDAGGPLKKDRLFWFYGYAQYRRNFPGTGKAAAPSTFFTLPDAVAPSGATCNLTGTNAGYMSGLTYASSSTQFSVDEQACELAARLGYAGYAAGASAFTSQLTNLLSDLGSVHRTGDELLNTPKIDWQVTQKNHASFLFHRLRWDSPGGVQTQATNTYAIDGFGNDFVKLDYGLAKLDTLVTSGISNELRYQYGRELNDESQQPFSAYTEQNLKSTNGINAAGAGGFVPNVPQVALDNPSSVGFYLGSLYYAYRKALPDERKWQVGDTAAWVKGNHSFKFGIDMVHNYDLLNNTYESNGVYTYSYLGNYFADLLNEGNSTGVCNNVGTVSAPGSATTDYVGTDPCGTFVQGFGPTTWDLATMDYGYFVEDHWKLTPRLTLDLGVRYDYESLPAPYSSLVTAAGSFVPYLASTNGLCAVYTGPGTCPKLAAEANLTNHPGDKNNIGPRIGLAYDPFGDGKTTVRLGYGLYYGRVTNGVLLNNLLNTGSPAGQYVSSTFGPTSAGAPLFPNITAAGSFSAPTSYFFSSNFQNPEVHEFDFSIQRELFPGIAVQLSYMGALGRELPNAVNINLNPNANTNTAAGSQPNGVIQSVITVSDTSGAGKLPNGAVYVVPTYSRTNTSTTANLLNPNFGAVNELMSNINSSYNAMVAEIQNKSSKRLQYDVNYTWSHALDYNQNESTTTLGNGVFDPYNIDGYPKGANYGNSSFNVPNRLVAWALINAPTVDGSGWAKWIANGWSLNPVYQAQNGLPYSATIGTGSPATSAYSSSWNGAGSNFWIPEIGRDTFEMKRTMVVDMRLEKQFDLNVADKPYHLQLMGEFFNVANHQNVTGVITTAYNLSSNSSVTAGCAASLVAGQTQDECSTLTYVPKAGSGTAASGFGAVNNSGSNFAYSPRQIQLSLRLDF